MPELELVTNHRLDCDLGDDCSCQPVYGSRAREPGPRGCWALKRDGTHCGAAARRDGDYCGAHSGATPVSADPARWAPIGRAASAQARTRRATLRAALGITRPETARALLKGMVFVERERLAAAALAPALDPDVPALARGRHALQLLDAVEPLARAEVSVDVPTRAEDVDGLGLDELRSLLGGDPSPPSLQAR